MRKQFFILVFAVFCSTLMAQQQADSTKMVQLEEVIVSSLKETSPQQTPLSSTTLSAGKIAATQITSIRDLSGQVPNFFIPNYGSSMSTTSYIRGIGSRNSGQSMALYVDNVPYFDKSTFDFDFYDIRQIEVLRGAQGTLYGRNAEGGIVNIYTLSPLSYQGTKLSVNVGNYGLVGEKLAHYGKLGDNFGYAISGYYNHDDGFFTNKFTNQSADASTSAGGRVKLDWNISPSFKAQYSTNFDYVSQDAFPYGAYSRTTGVTAQPDFNDPGSYKRNMLTNSLFLQYKTSNWTLSSISSHQYFKDEMKMDNDFTTMSFFTIEQAQKQNAFNEEIILKSNSTNNYQWSFGATGFVQQLDNNAPVELKSDAIKYILQPSFTKMGMTITDQTLRTPGQYNTKTSGGALFHQSTYNNFLVDGLSITGGLRVDYEKIDLDYNTNSAMHIKMGPTTYLFADTLKNNLSIHFSELLPKVALKYEWSNRQFVYANVSRGYKAGGYNVQMFADLVDKGLQNPAATKKQAVMDAISYKPEYSWNYEIGGQCLTFDNHLKTSISIFYSDLSNLQLTQFVPSGFGRKISNAGAAVSKGVEVSLDANIGAGFSAALNYGYANASFTTYTDSVKITDPVTHKVTYAQVNYKGNHVPYAPQNTLSASVGFEHNFKNTFIDHLMATVQYIGVGKIYWTEANDIAQDFYSQVNAKLAVNKGGLGLEFWVKNLFDTKYNAFYFNASGSEFFQQGKPMQLGATLKFEF